MSILSEAYKQKARVTFEIVEHTGQAVALDADFYFAKVRLEDGSETEATFDARPPEIGQTAVASLGLPVFEQGDGTKTGYSGKMLHPIGTPGGMPTFFGVTPH